MFYSSMISTIPIIIMENEHTNSQVQVCFSVYTMFCWITYPIGIKYCQIRIAHKVRLYLRTSFIYKYKTSKPLTPLMKPQVIKWCFVLLNKWHTWVQFTLHAIRLCAIRVWPKIFISVWWNGRIKSLGTIWRFACRRWWTRIGIW